MIDTTLGDLLLRSRDCDEGMAIQKAYEAGRIAGRLEGLEEAMSRIRGRISPASSYNSLYSMGLRMALNDICDLVAGGRLMEEVSKR